MSCRLVVFDLDGTLVDSSRDLAAAMNATLARVEPEAGPLTLDQVRSFIGEGARKLVARSLAAVRSRHAVEDVLPVFMEEYGRRLLDTTRLYPGVEEGLAALGERTLAVLTNKPGALSRRILEGLGVSSRFARIYGGDDLPERKPEPAGLLRLIAELGATPEQTVLVGDSGVDVRTGRAAGVRTIGVSYGFDPTSLEALPPDLLIDDMRELAGRL